jgi:hypothetical protein
MMTTTLFDGNTLTPEERQRGAEAMMRQAGRLLGTVAPQHSHSTPAQAAATFSGPAVHFSGGQDLAALERIADAQRAEIARERALLDLLDPYGSACRWAEQENCRTGRGGQQGTAAFSQGGMSEPDPVYDATAAWAHKRNQVDRQARR